MKLEKKRRSIKGETLLETLVAILILTISAMMLAEMTASSVRINRTVEKIDKEYRENVSAAEKRKFYKNETVTIKTTDKEYTYKVEYYGKADGLTSYKAEEGEI